MAALGERERLRGLRVVGKVRKVGMVGNGRIPTLSSIGTNRGCERMGRSNQASLSVGGGLSRSLWRI